MYKNCYDIILTNQDYTLGKIIEYAFHTKYYESKIATFCGFQKKHPHDDFSIIRLSFINEVEPKSEINSIIEYTCQVGKRIFNHIKDL